MNQAPKASRWIYLFAALPKATYLETRNLTPSETNTYLFLVDRLNGNTRDGWTIPISDFEMMDALGYRRETISRARTGLVEKGLILQVDHELRHKRVFYVAPPEMVYQMKLCLLAVLLREGRKEGLGVETVKRPRREPPPTPPPASDNDSVSTCSQNAPIINVAKPDVESVSADPPALRKDLSLDIYKENLSPVIPVPEEEKTAEQVETNRERDLADLFYEEVLERPLRDRQKRRRINRECNRLIADIAADPRVESPDAAREILIDAFQRVKGYAPYSFGIMSADYGERSIEWAIQTHQTRLETSDSPDLSDTSTPETNVLGPTSAEIDAALLEAWSDDRWQEWADGHVADLVKVRQRLVAMNVGLEPYTEAEIADMRAKFTMPITDDEKLDWLRSRVEDHAERKEIPKPLDRQQPTAIPENPDDRLALLKARGVQVEHSGPTQSVGEFLSAFRVEGMAA